MSDVARHSGLPFMKMHGLGNDFVVIDARVTARAVTAELARALADRHRGVGFDQLAVIEPDDTADLRLSSSTPTAPSRRPAATPHAASRATRWRCATGPR
jgi:hypothetical protein